MNNETITKILALPPGGRIWVKRDGAPEWPTDTLTTDDLIELARKVKAYEEREVAVFAKGYRSGFFDGKGATAFNDEVKEAFERWNANGRKTHLDREAFDALKEKP